MAGETLEQSSEEFYGTLIGNFKNYAHGISGSVYAVDEDTIAIKGFSYDGSAPGLSTFCCFSPKKSANVKVLSIFLCG